MDRSKPPFAQGQVPWSLPPNDSTLPMGGAQDSARANGSFDAAMNQQPLHPKSLMPQSLANNTRFAPLSALPEGKGLPPRRDVDGSSAPAAAAGIMPRQLPGLPHSNPQKQPLQFRPPAALPARQEKQLGFNCPSCMTILIIKQPESYDGQAAPCPHCGVVILPPRIAPSSPFTLLSQGTPRLGLPGPGGSGPGDQIPVGRPAPGGQPSHQPRKPGLPGAKGWARAAMF